MSPSVSDLNELDDEMDYAKLVSQLESIAADPPEALLNNEPVRKRLLQAATHVIPEIEKPNDSAQRILYAPLELMAALIGYNSHVFKTLSNSTRPLDTEHLAAVTGADPYLFERLLKFMASLSMIKEVNVGTWQASRLTRALTIEGIAEGVYHNHENLGATWLAFPRFLEKTKYQAVAEPDNCAFSHSHEDKSIFRWFGENPRNAQAFNKWMGQQRFGQALWLDVFPLEEIVRSPGDKSNRFLFVDVAGGLGHQCEAVLARFPQFAGRIVLEDQPSVLATSAPIKGAEKIEIDFFHEQPVKGAKAYYLRNILHDWPDDRSRTILSHIKAAMAGDSLLLIDEMVIPTKGAHKIAMQLDMTMYSNLASEERTEKRWKELLDAAGFKIEQVYTYQDELRDSIIVATAL